MRSNSGKFLNLIRWVIAIFMWLMALGTFSYGGLGILGGILFVIFGFIVSPLSSKYLFPRFPNIKKSHTILGAAGIWLAANIFMGVAVPSTPDTDLVTDTTETVAEETTETMERSIPSIETEEAEKASTVTDEEEKIAAQKAAEEEAAKKAEEEAAQKAADEEAAKKAEEEAAQKAAEEEAAKKAEEEAAQKAAEEEAAKKAEEEAAQKAAEEEATKKAEEAAAQQTAQQADSSTVANGTESASALAVLQMGPTTGSPCWVPRNGGTKYHSNSGCSGMDDPIYTTVDTATACGFDACKRCH